MSGHFNTNTNTNTTTNIITLKMWFQIQIQGGKRRGHAWTLQYKHKYRYKYKFKYHCNNDANTNMNTGRRKERSCLDIATQTQIKITHSKYESCTHKVRTTSRVKWTFNLSNQSFKKYSWYYFIKFVRKKICFHFWLFQFLWPLSACLSAKVRSWILITSQLFQ